MNTPNPLTIDCLSWTHNGIPFGAGVCYVSIGHSRPIRAVACRAGDARFITTPEDAPDWLNQHGLPAYIAEPLVNAALAIDAGSGVDA